MKGEIGKPGKKNPAKAGFFLPGSLGRSPDKCRFA
jgi:hypothetical protein